MKIERAETAQPIPEDAKLVFQGIIFDVYQWQQKDFEGNVLTFERLKRPDSVVILPVTEDGKIIYALEEQPGRKPMLGCLSGRIEKDEDVLQAAKREFLEESGFESSDWQLLESFQPVNKIDWCIYTFVAKGCKKVQEQTLDGGEKIDVKFADFDSFVEIATQKDFVEYNLKLRFLEAKTDPKKMEELRSLFLN